MAGLSSPPAAGVGVGKLDSAETFVESDLTLTHTETEVGPEQVELGGSFNDGIEDGSNDGYTSRGTYDTATATNSTAYWGSYSLLAAESGSFEEGVYDWNAAETPDRLVFACKSAGQGEVRFRESGTKLISLQLSNSGNFHVNGNDTGVAEDGSWHLFDYRGIDFGADSVAEVYVDGTQQLTGVAFQNGGTAIDQHQVRANSNDVYADFGAESGSVIVEWPDPPDLKDWDRVLHEVVADGATASVYVEENNGQWTEIAGPTASGDSLPADPDNETRLRVDFSRPEGEHSIPHVESIYRRWIVG